MTRLQKMREELMLSPEELAERIDGVSGRTIRRIERGEVEPQLGKLRNLNAYFRTEGFSLVDQVDAPEDVAA